ncbi:MAG: 3-phosphoshikimate 1-carboxyvinyltransferase [Deltaproteobacteria bacterium]|nr:3-phosphoshikimate 1-carboxyvinyltransferase [Deltaproteobacteria bacterium]
MGVVKVHEATGPLKGALNVPGDKSIAHRAVIFSCIAEGKSRIVNLSGGEDNSRTVKAFKDLGVKIWSEGDDLLVEGKGWEGLSKPANIIDCGNSGTTMRLLAGVLAGRPFTTTLDGDLSLRARPMRRIIDPLGRMGTRIVSQNDKGLAPLEIHGGPMKGICYETPVPSAQVKSAILLAGLQALGMTTVKESQRSRDHTEIMAQAFGADLTMEGCSVSLKGPQKLSHREVKIPGDLSSAAFFMVAAAAIPGSNITIKDVGCNSTRSGVIDVLRSMGATVELQNQRHESGELVADLKFTGGKLKAAQVGEEMAARTIDEYPVLAVAGALAEGVTTFSGVKELRYKESDRIDTMTRELRKLGVEVEDWEDGMTITGRGRLRGARLESYGDHRVAMSLAVAGLVAEGGVEIANSDCVNISFPGFFDLLRQLR